MPERRLFQEGRDLLEFLTDQENRLIPILPDMERPVGAIAAKRGTNPTG